MNFKRYHLNLLHLIYKIFIIYSIIISVLCFRFLFNANIHINQMQIDKVTQEEYTITSQKIRLPTEHELHDFQKNQIEILHSFNEMAKLLIEIDAYYQETKNAPVCSQANKNFNSLESTFNSFKQTLSTIQKQISSLEEQYILYLDMIYKIPEYSPLHNRMYHEFMEQYGSKHEYILTKNAEYINDKEEIYDLYLEAQQIAQNLFEEYFDLMCHIVYAEAGSLKCTTMERCYVANVIENRIKSDSFPNSIYEVIYQSGQYAPAMSGSIHKTPSQQVINEVEAYLRGYVETEMPDNVVFQALFTQGKGVWKEMPSGHFFCY